MKYRIPNILLDNEVYKNYVHFGFTNIETGNVVQLECYDGHPLDAKRLHQIMLKSRTMGFNSNNYDVPIIWLAISLARKYPPAELCKRLKRASDQIIQGGLRPWEFRDLYSLNPPRIDHVDLFEVAPGMASLKIYGGRLHSKRMQDLPIAHDAEIQPDQRDELLVYNRNDLETTGDLRNKLIPQLKLRCDMSKQYGQDLRSKSDAQIAEAVINSELQKLTGVKPSKNPVKVGTSFHYQVPDFLDFETEIMRDVLETIRDTEFVVGQGGKVNLPQHVKDLNIEIGTSVYRMGIGGLHSSEESVSHHADDDYILVDRDVASYYPRIILNQGLFPAHMGKLFLKVYQSIVDRRLKAKATVKRIKDDISALKSNPEGLDRAAAKKRYLQLVDDKAKWETETDSLKITINGSFGKFGSQWSTLYSPTLLIQTTVTGQLALLMLIERLEVAGISVVSANTDGVVIRCHKRDVDKLNHIVAQWEEDTAFETEETPYRSLFSRDVNNYIAIKPDGEYKAKGAYAEPGLQKNPANQICVKAVVEKIVNGTPISDTIRACDDVREFVTIRQVKGGGYKQWSRRQIPDHDTPEQLLLSQRWRLIEVTSPKTGRVSQKWVKSGVNTEAKAWTVKKAYDFQVEQCLAAGEEEYLGKAVRWVYCTDSAGPIRYKLNGNNVPKSEGAYPMMELPDKLPANLDYNWYIREANSILKDIGYVEPPIPQDVADLI